MVTGAADATLAGAVYTPPRATEPIVGVNHQVGPWFEKF